MKRVTLFATAAVLVLMAVFSWTAAAQQPGGDQAAREALQLRFARFDKGGEETFNFLSAFHKSLRGIDPQGAEFALVGKQ